MEYKLLKSPSFKGSKKDLVNVAMELKNKMSSRGYERTLEHFKELFRKQHYIRYTKHLSGVSHHKNLGPSRRPLKTYKFIIETLKNQAYFFKANTEYDLKRVLVLNGSRQRLGLIRRARNRAYSKRGRTYSYVMEILVRKKQSVGA
jgi:hypothetical protein